MAVPKKEKQESFRRNELKWTPTLIDAGWTLLPSVILERQQELGLDAIDVNILLHLARHWWYSEKPPYPSKKTIAECMNIDQSTVRRHIARLEAAGLIKRKPRFDLKHGGQKTNEYQFEGLIKAATPYAQELIEERKKRKEEDTQRQTRKRPLHLVTPGKQE
jgi:DNA-binding transcriptional ArsR family regulator